MLAAVKFVCNLANVRAPIANWRLIRTMSPGAGCECHPAARGPRPRNNEENYRRAGNQNSRAQAVDGVAILMLHFDPF
jgi:hypothetical protein